MQNYGYQGYSPYGNGLFGGYGGMMGNYGGMGNFGGYGGMMGNYGGYGGYGGMGNYGNSFGGMMGGGLYGQADQNPYQGFFDQFQTVMQDFFANQNTQQGSAANAPATPTQPAASTAPADTVANTPSTRPPTQADMRPGFGAAIAKTGKLAQGGKNQLREMGVTGDNRKQLVQAARAAGVTGNQNDFQNYVQNNYQQYQNNPTPQNTQYR